DRFGGDFVEVEVLFIGAGPHGGPHVRLVPDFPILDAMVEAVRPAFIVMADNAAANGSPFFRVGWRMDVILSRGVFDALSEPIDDLRSDVDDRLDVVVRLPEIVAIRARRI